MYATHRRSQTRIFTRFPARQDRRVSVTKDHHKRTFSRVYHYLTKIQKCASCRVSPLDRTGACHLQKITNVNHAAFPRYTGPAYVTHKSSQIRIWPRFLARQDRRMSLTKDHKCESCRFPRLRRTGVWNSQKITCAISRVSLPVRNTWIQNTFIIN